MKAEKGETKMENTLAKFEELVRDHDLTYSYSDDHSCWVRGKDQIAVINKMMAHLPRKECVLIWNKYVDKKIVESARAQFHWKE